MSYLGSDHLGNFWMDEGLTVCGGLTMLFLNNVT